MPDEITPPTAAAVLAYHEGELASAEEALEGAEAKVELQREHLAAAEQSVKDAKADIKRLEGVVATARDAAANEEAAAEPTDDAPHTKAGAGNAAGKGA